MKAQASKAEDLLERLQLAATPAPGRTVDLRECQSLMYQVRMAVKHKEFRRDFCDQEQLAKEVLSRAATWMNAALYRARQTG